MILVVPDILSRWVETFLIGNTEVNTIAALIEGKILRDASFAASGDMYGISSEVLEHRKPLLIRHVPAQLTAATVKLKRDTDYDSATGRSTLVGTRMFPRSSWTSGNDATWSRCPPLARSGSRSRNTKRNSCLERVLRQTRPTWGGAYEDIHHCNPQLFTFDRPGLGLTRLHIEQVKVIPKNTSGRHVDHSETPKTSPL